MRYLEVVRFHRQQMKIEMNKKKRPLVIEDEIMNSSLKCISRFFPLTDAKSANVRKNCDRIN